MGSPSHRNEHVIHVIHVINVINVIDGPQTDWRCGAVQKLRFLSRDSSDNGNQSSGRMRGLCFNKQNYWCVFPIELRLRQCLTASVVVQGLWLAALLLSRASEQIILSLSCFLSIYEHDRTWVSRHGKGTRQSLLYMTIHSEVHRFFGWHIPANFREKLQIYSDLQILYPPW